MALRYLLRRIAGPVLLSPSGPRMGPVHGISPPPASRFMGTQSQQGRGRLTAKELDEILKTTRVRLAEHKRAADNLEKLGNVAIALVAAFVPVLLICATSYEPEYNVFHQS